MRHAVACATLLSISLLSACTGADGDEPPALTCPTPSEVQLTPAAALTGRDLLRTPAFFDLMAAHGSMNDVYDVIVSAVQNPGVARGEDIERMYDVIAFRTVRGCRDVPSYNPYTIDLPFGRPDLSGLVSGPALNPTVEG